MPYTDQPDDRKSKWGTFQDVLVPSTISGGLAGATEVLVDHPFWTLKTRHQNEAIPRGSKFTLNPRTLYRGIGPNMLSMIPISALQVTAAAVIKRFFPENKHSGSTSPSIDLFSSCMGGALSATVSGPTELIMSHQQKGRGFITTGYHMFKTGGVRSLTTGLSGTAGRDGIFAGGYLFLAPFLKKKLKPFTSDPVATVASGVCAGVSAAIASHPLDTLKTIQQTSQGVRNANNVENMWQIGKRIVRQEGVKALYKGGIWRGARVISAVTLMSTVNEKVQGWLKGNKP
ncbi:MAG TPA: MC/SLC25 family protein [Gammaproteobacteria bacterium]|nr:MC/SLC25 family protein [Gammaproteobacteria bacterium]